ncbi:TMEM175 family protein [Streptococcus sp. H49]|uniref:TMEM175 family protein n=1 Tax=Streptococcus huangxiaojuni TaxID=3237239 RepID=UPI0034A48D08
MKKIYERFDTLSDAIIAIIMTILVLGISAPETAEELPDFMKEVSLYLISFILLINVWYRRTKLTLISPITKLEAFVADVGLHALLTLFPLAIKMLVTYANPLLSVLFFGVLNLLVMCFLNAIPIIELGDHWVRGDFSEKVHRFYHRRLLLTFASHLIVLVLACCFIRVGVYVYLLLLLVDFWANYNRDKGLNTILNNKEELRQGLSKKLRLQKEKS